MNQRFFSADVEVYESVRLGLDQAWGHPSPGTATCFTPAEIAPRNNAGHVLLAVVPEFCEYEAVAAMLPQLLANGSVTEITEAEYLAALPQMP